MVRLRRPFVRPVTKDVHTSKIFLTHLDSRGVQYETTRERAWTLNQFRIGRVNRGRSGRRRQAFIREPAGLSGGRKRSGRDQPPLNS
jgi:hypothetical protein